MANPLHLSPHRRSVVGLILLVGVGLTLASWQYTARKENERIRSGFLSRAQTQAAVVVQKLRNYEEMVYSLRDAFIGQEFVSRDEFGRVAKSLLQRHAGVQALEWVRIVSDAERADFEQNFAKEIGRPIVIVRRQPDNSVRTAPADREYFVITYVTPTAGNDVVLGYDVQSAPTEPLVRAARVDHQLKVSQPLRLFQSTSPTDEPGVVFILPFWRTGPQGDLPVEGFVQGVFHVRTMLAQSHQITTGEALDTYYIDEQVPAGTSPLLYANFAGAEPARLEKVALPPLDDPADVHETLVVGNRRWRMVMRPNAAWVRRIATTQANTVLVSGLTITALFALFTNTLLQRTRRIEEKVTERTRELNASEARLQAILDHSPAIIFVKDLEGRYRLFNQPFVKACPPAIRPLQGRTDAELFPAEEAARYREHDLEVITRGQPRQFEERGTRPDGSVVISLVDKFLLLDESGRPYALCGIATDITDRKAGEEQKLQLERRLLESQKFESLGVLAGGIAHDFNNILTAILGNASLASLELPADHVIRPQLRQIEQAARRASDLCAQMLAYAGKTAFITTPVSLTTLVRETAALLEVTVGRRVRLELQTTADLPAVLGDATQLRQIVMNLVINAADAIGERPGGTIIIQTFARELTAEFLAGAVQSPVLAPGRYVALQVTDNGSGMGPEVMARIFEPFFTTKFSGRGLGLAAAVGIVQSHRGALFVESRLGHGTTFRLFFPASKVSADPQSAAAPPAPPMLRGTVLVVDDEEAVRLVALKSLRAAGLHAFEAADGETGLEVHRAQAGRIDLVLLDLTMPGIGGEETLRRLRALAPSLPVIVMSGYSEGETMRRCASLGVSGYLAKPFEIADLLARIAPLLR